MLFETKATYADGRSYRQHAIDDRYLIDFFDAASPTLVITFHAFGQINPRTIKTDAPWGFNFLAGHDVSVVGVKPTQQDWYRGGGLHIFFRSADFQKFVRQFDRVILYGGSMGGFAALVFSDAVPGAEVLALSPQSTLDSRIVPWDNRFPLGVNQNWDGDFTDAAIHARSAKRIYIVYDPLCSPDHAHVCRLDRGNIIALRTPFFGHGASVWLQKTGLLKPLVRDVIQNALDPAAFARSLRIRRNLAHYHIEMARKAGSRRNDVRQHALARAHAMAVGNVVALAEIADTYIKDKNTEMAEIVLQNIITTNPKLPHGYYRLSKMLHLEDRLSEALPLAIAALERAPNNAVYNEWCETLRTLAAREVEPSESSHDGAILSI